LGGRKAGRRSDADWQIRALLAERAVFPVYQPIVDLATGDVVGAEALARGPAGSALEYPDALFQAAIEADLLPQVDMLCGTRALQIARAAGPAAPPLIFVNAEPAALRHPLPSEMLEVLHDDLQFRIVLEFTERALAAYPSALLSVANMVHRFGNAVALDDVGAEPLSLAFLPLIEPEVVKLDMHLLRNPYAPGTQEVATVVAAYAQRTGAVVLAEGIETETDLEHARFLGARWGQGWHFGRPGPLTALPGRRAERAELGEARPHLHAPTGTPFQTIAGAPPCLGGERWHTTHQSVTTITEQLLRTAAEHGPHAVVLAACHRSDAAARWLPQLARLAESVAFVGLISPPLAGRNVPGLTYAVPTPSDPPEEVLCIVSPGRAMAMCTRGERGVEVAVTYDLDTAHAVARHLITRLDIGNAREEAATHPAAAAAR
jgi:EAL domain-containing protein (putative c-di-GMP-specific phosphodiesterase class I)